MALIDVVNPSGEVVQIPSEQMQEASAIGYSQATPEQIKLSDRQAKFGTAGQQAITGLEGAASAASFGLSHGAERALGVSPEDIVQRAQENPISHGAGEVAGLGASMLSGIGEGALVEKAGTSAAEAVSNLLGKKALRQGTLLHGDFMNPGMKMLEEVTPTLLGRVGSSAAKSAVESALMQSGDEVAKMMVNDPNQTVETAAANIGLGGLVGGALGGGLGTTSELWKLRNNEKLGAVLDKIKDAAGDHVPSIVGTAASAMLGHNPLIGYAIGQIGEHVPGIARAPMALMKFLGSDAATSGEGFHAMTGLLQQAVRGEVLLNKSVNSVIKGNEFQDYPGAGEIDKLKKRVDELAQNPEQAFGFGGNIGHYMPEHGTALAETAGRSMQYLQQLRPDTTPMGALDPEKIPNAAAEARYNNALGIAQAPLTVMRSVKDGSITPDEIADLSTMYPGLFTRLKDELSKKIIDAKSEKANIPYSTKIGMSLFLGQPMDSSLTWQSIGASQGFNIMPQQTGAQQAKPMLSQKNPKSPGFAATPDQAREQARSTGHS